MGGGGLYPTYPLYLSWLGMFDYDPIETYVKLYDFIEKIKDMTDEEFDQTKENINGL